MASDFAPLLLTGSEEPSPNEVRFATGNSYLSQQDDVNRTGSKVTNREHSMQLTAQKMCKADVTIETPNIYVSVLVSAFGGVTTNYGGGDLVKVHPIFLLMLCLPVTSVQVSIVLYLRFDLELYTRIDTIDTETGLGQTKIALVVICYLMSFKSLRQSIMHFMFIANPITWVELTTYSRDVWMAKRYWISWISHNIPLWPFPILAVIMNFGVTYLVCIESVSVILSSATAKDAIFNSLAITFILDLATHWWSFCAYLFHFEPFENHEFLIDDTRVWESGDCDRLTEGVRQTMVCTWCIERILWATTWKCVEMKHSFLRQGHGARRMAQACSGLALSAMYIRQLFVVLQAYDTKILPAARDLCSEYRLQTGSGVFSYPYRFFQQFLWVQFVDELTARIKKHESLKHACESEYLPLSWNSARDDLFPPHRRCIIIFVTVIVLLLVVPKALPTMRQLCCPPKDNSSAPEPTEGAKHELRFHRMEEQIDRMDLDLEKIRDDSEAHKDKFNKLVEVLSNERVLLEKKVDRGLQERQEQQNKLQGEVTALQARVQDELQKEVTALRTRTEEQGQEVKTLRERFEEQDKLQELVKTLQQQVHALQQRLNPQGE